MAKKSSNQDKLQLSQQTMDYLGLSQQPFTTDILSAQAYYSDASLEQAFDTIKHHLQFSNLVLIIEGDLGAGKTTFFRHLIQQDLANLKVLSILPETTDTLVQIQQKMSIHLQDQGDANYLDDNLKHLSVFDQTPVIVIDDAHILSDTTLQELIRYQKQLEMEKETQLKILLLANKGMTKTLEQISDIQASQRYTQEIPEFTPKQISAFIEHKLVVAGYAGAPLLDNDSIQYIFKKSTGTPLDTMVLAANRLEYLTKKNTRSAIMSPAKIALAVGALCLAGAIAYGGFLFFQPEPAPQPNPVIVSPLYSSEMETITPEETESKNTPVSDTEAPAEVIAEVSQEQTDQSLGPIETLIESTADATIVPPAEESIIAAEEPENTTTTPVNQATETETVAPETVPTIETQKPVAPAVTVDAKKEIKTETTAIETVTETKPAEPEPAPKPRPSADPAFNQLAALGIRDADWLAAQNKNHWTLQILGAREPATLVKFARKHKLGEDSAWYKTWLKGKPWYVLVHRFYTDRDIARKSISRLPAGLQKSRPWVKSVASIHKAIGK